MRSSSVDKGERGSSTFSADEDQVEKHLATLRVFSFSHLQDKFALFHSLYALLNE